MKVFIILILCMIALVFLVAPAFADQADPDSTPTVEQINWYRNLLETGDKFIFTYVNIPYTTTPNATMPQAFIWQLIGTDNITVHGQTTGYAYNDSGYGYNVIGMYFDSTENITWEGLYYLKLVGNPAIFDDPKEYYYPVAISDYTSLIDSTDNKLALATRVLELGSDLDIKWGLSSVYSLLYESEAGTVLSIYGESFFRGAIQGIQALAPTAFRLVIQDIDADDRTWDSEYADNLTTQYADSWIEPAKAGGAAIFGLGYDLFSIILVIGMCIGLLWANLVLTKDNWNVAIDIAIILIAAPKIDLIPLSFTALICALFVLYEGTKVKVFIR